MRQIRTAHISVACRRLRSVVCAVFAVVAALYVGPAFAQATFSYENEPMREVLSDIEERTGFHFLYRDALIAGVKVSLSGRDDELLDALDGALDEHRLDLKVDSARKQILVLEEHEQDGTIESRIIQGVVIDDEHGMRLPHATVTWYEGNNVRGTVANEAGAFRVEMQPGQGVDLTISYVGYRAQSVRIQPNQRMESLPVRLVPQHTFGPEVVVSTAALHTELDTSWHHLLHEGIFSPLGNGGVLRSLQVLPSVSFSTASSSGLNVRGSRVDGFQVLLDGMSIYSRDHFFGLFDAFNEDVLQTVGLYYSVPPATLEGPPGGTVSFVTRTGSQGRYHASVGLGSTSGKLTVEGPLFDGRGSWLLSGRRSYLNAVDWFNNKDLVGLGLDVGRQTSPLRGPIRELSDYAVIAGDASASFYDVHAKIFHEWGSGTRLMLNAYVGGDDARHDAVRLVADVLDREIDEKAVETETDWGNAAGSLQLHAPIGAGAYLLSTAGFSRYHSSFSKDDFVYTDPTQSLLTTVDTTDHAVRPFRNENELVEVKLSQEADISAASHDVVTAGYALHHYHLEYREESALRDFFSGSRSSMQSDLFAQYAASLSKLDALLGLRSHYFSHGDYFRLSPRLRVRLLPGYRVSFSAGYSRNHQFIHQLYLEQNATSDVWVLSTPNQAPTSVDHVTAGVYVSATRSFFFQVETYLKEFRNLREHVASAARRRLMVSSPILDPWLHDNEGLARGIELLARKELGPLLWTNSYTWSRMEISNPQVNGGAPYPADWDRRHQFSTHVLLTASPSLTAHIAWMWASGAPNALASVRASEPSRLEPYHRMDIGAKLQRRLAGGILTLEAAIFNLYDEHNTWYRSPVAVVGRTAEGRRLGLLNVDVYDLGFQPSFEVTFRF